MLFVTVCSVYHPDFNGSGMSNGQRYDHWKGLTAASRKYGLGTLLEVKYNGKKIRVRVTDRIGVSHADRLDLSGRAMHDLTGKWCSKQDMSGCTLIKAEIRVIKPEVK